MAGFENGVMVAKNLNFDEAAAKPHLGILNAAGKFPIGTGNSSPTPEILAGSITSPDSSVTVSYSSPNITLQVAGGSTTVLTLTGNTGGPISPTAGNTNTVGTGSITIDGSGSTLATQLTGLTNHAVLVGAGTATITKVGPTATAGQVLQSAGASADPAFSTATYPATTTINQVLYSSANNTVAGLAAVNQSALTTTTTGVPTWVSMATDGKLLIGSTAGNPSAATLTAGTGVSITNASGSITVNAVGSGLTWSVITGASQAMAVNNGYIANRAGTVAFTLPTTSAVGDVISVFGMNTALGWSIAYTTNQQIFLGTSSATITTGTLASTAIRDAITLVCTTANLTWTAISSIGNITVT